MVLKPQPLPLPPNPTPNLLERHVPNTSRRLRLRALKTRMSPTQALDRLNRRIASRSRVTTPSSTLATVKSTQNFWTKLLRAETPAQLLATFLDAWHPAWSALCPPNTPKIGFSLPMV
jgi:hypothetical protein